MSYLPNTGLVTLGGDVTGPSNANVVGAISGFTSTSPVFVIPPLMEWLAASVSPTINQQSTTVATANSFTLQSQSTTGSTGGNLILASGTGASVQGTLISRVGSTTVEQHNLSTSDFIAFGPSPATASTIRLSNNESIQARNAANSGDINLVSIDSSNNVQFGGTNGLTTVTSATQTAVIGATSSIIINSTAVVFGQNNLQFQNGTSTAPLFSHQSTGGTTGSTFTIQAQNATGASSTGGALVLQSGSGTSFPGVIRNNVSSTTVLQQSLNTGSDFISFGATPAATGTIRLTNNQQIVGRNVANSADINLVLLDTANNITVGGSNSITLVTCATQLQLQGSTSSIIVNSSAVVLNQNNFQFANGTATAPVITHQSTGGTTGSAMTISAQNATGGSSTGGSLTISAGSGTSTGGAVNINAGTGTTNSGTITLNANVGSSGIIINSPAAIFSNTTFGANAILSVQTNSTASATATPLTLLGQSLTGTNTIGGAVILKPGSGTLANGTVVLENTAGNFIAHTDNNKFNFDSGNRRHVTYISFGTSSYQTLITDDLIIYDCQFNANPVCAILLPNNATTGDQYEYAFVNLGPSGAGGNIQSVAVVSVSGGSPVFNIYVPTLCSTVNGQSFNQGSAGASFGRLRFTWSGGSAVQRWICDIYA